MLEELQENAQWLTPPIRLSSAVEASRAPRARFAVALLFLVNGASVGSWVPHIPERAHVLHLNPAQLGSVLVAGGIGGLCAMPLAGALVRRFGSKATAVTAGLLFPTLLCLAMVIPSAALLGVVLYFTGMSAAVMDVSMNAHGVLVERLLGRRTVSLFHALFSVGCFAGAGSQSFLMAHRVPNAVLAPLFAGALVAGILCAVPLLYPAKAERDREMWSGHTETAVPVDLKQQRLRLPHPRLLLLGVLCFSTMVSEGAIGDWGALFLHVVHHLPNGTAGYGYTCFAGLMVLGRLAGDQVVARLGEMRVLRLGGSLSAAGLLLLLSAHLLPIVLLGFTLAGAGLANASPILYRTAGTVRGFAPGEGLATAVGVGYAGLLLGPPLLGLLGRSAGLPSIFWVLMGLSAVLAGGAGLIRTFQVEQNSRDSNP